MKAGDLLTPVTVMVTVLTFLWTIRKDLRTAKGAEADKVRNAASKSLGKLERWKEMALWITETSSRYSSTQAISYSGNSTSIRREITCGWVYRVPTYRAERDF